MNQPVKPDRAPGPPASRSMLDVLIRAGLILLLAYLCYRVLAPFLVLVVWALILAVAMYPLHQAVARRIAGRQGLAAVLVTVLAVVLIVVPTAVLLGSLGDSVRQLITDVQQDTLRIPPPRPGLSKLPLIGGKAHAVWQAAHDDLPALVRSLQPKIGELAKDALAMVASIGGGILQFLGALIVAGIVMAFGEGGDRASCAIFARLADEEHGAEYAHLATSTIRAVAQGVIGVDSGLSHIAVALDLPHVQLYNFATAWRTGPQANHGHRHQVALEGRPPSVQATWLAWSNVLVAAS